MHLMTWCASSCRIRQLRSIKKLIAGLCRIWPVAIDCCVISPVAFTGQFARLVIPKYARKPHIIGMSSKLIETSKHDIAGEFDIRFQYRVLGSRANKELAISFPCFFHVIIWYSMSIRVQSISSISLLKTHTCLFPIFSISLLHFSALSVLCQCQFIVHFFVGLV